MTNTTEIPFTRKEIALIALLSILSMLLVTATAITSLREKIRSTIQSDQREILAKVTGAISTQGPRLTVFKIKEKSLIHIEIYTHADENQLNLLHKISLEENRDGYIALQGQATNLALMDIDHDGKMELITPTFDDQMVPRLNVYKFNQETNSFDKINGPPTIN